MIERIRAQAVFNAVFMGLVLVGISACGSSSSGGGTPGLTDERPPLAGGFDTNITPAQTDAHTKHAAAAGNAPLLTGIMATGADSSVTQGSIPATAATTTDAVFLTIASGAAPTAASIDVGNSGTAGLTGATPGTALPSPAMGDRRGTLGAENNADDPLWAYGTRSFVTGTVATPAENDYAVHLVDWSPAGNDAGYLGGGVWSRSVSATEMEFGAFVDGGTPTLMAAVEDATGTATYRGHSYGRYATLPAAEADSGNLGFFAAKATLTAEFGDASARGMISGTISDFLFSQDNSFTSAMESDLEDAIGGAGDDSLTITLGGTDNISATDGTFAGATSGMLALGPTSGNPRMMLTLAGRWGGRFYGTPVRTGYLPSFVGGTWGATGREGDPEMDGFSLSLIGSFGAGFNYDESGVDLLGLIPGTGAEDGNHAKYVLAAGAGPLFAPDAASDADTSSVTQGSVIVSNTTDDSIVLTLASNLPTAVDAVSINVDDDSDATNDLDSTGNVEILFATADAVNDATRDRRLNNLGAGTATDPAWNYTTRTAVNGADNGAPGEFTATFVDWANESDGSYLGGGVWVRAINTTATDNEFGAFVDGGTPTMAAAVLAATGSATYRGHAYGRYSSNRVIESEANPGFFAAKATLTANFTTDRVSGTVSNFLFSETNTFVSGETSVLEAAIGGADGLTITLGDAPIVGNSFTGTTTSNTIRVGAETITLEGNWGGRFYGTPNVVSRDRPQLVGGTFGAADSAGGVGFSLIGAFGAKYDTSVDLTGLMFAGATADANHALYAEAAGNSVLFDTDAASDSVGEDSSVTQGSFDTTTDGTTEDAVYLTFDTTTATAVVVTADTGVKIDVGNTGSGALTSDGTSTPIDDTLANTNLDRRTTTGLLGAGTTTDPAWDYTTRTFQNGADLDAAGEFEATLVDWANTSDGSYLSGGVWVRTSDGTDRELGAFVDGEDTTSAVEIESARATATYRGHAYGRYSFGANGTGTTQGVGDGTDDELNPGYFAAKATLTANFAQNMAPTISGRITDFLFSTNNGFTDTSALETEIGGADGFAVHLGSTTVTRSVETNSFTGTATSSDILLPNNVRLSPTGTWGGRFYGTPTGTAAPPVVGGTFGVAAEEADGPSFSIIGAFGAKRQ